MVAVGVVEHIRQTGVLEGQALVVLAEQPQMEVVRLPLTQQVAAVGAVSQVLLTVRVVLEAVAS